MVRFSAGSAARSSQLGSQRYRRLRSWTGRQSVSALSLVTLRPNALLRIGNGAGGSGNGGHYECQSDGDLAQHLRSPCEPKWLFPPRQFGPTFISASLSARAVMTNGAAAIIFERAGHQCINASMHGPPRLQHRLFLTKGAPFRTDHPAPSHWPRHGFRGSCAKRMV